MSDEKISTELIDTICTFKVPNKEGDGFHRCNQKAISPTYPYCYKHMKALSSPALRFKRYEESMPELLKEQYEHQLQDNKATDLNPELANLRALLNTHLEKVKNTVTPDGNIELAPKDYATIVALIDQIRKMAEVQSRINPADYLHVEDVKKIVKEMVNIINVSIPNELVQLRQRIATNMQKYAENEMGAVMTRGIENKGRKERV